MPRNRKYYPHKSVLLCTTRTEEGLPFVASLLMNFILWGIIARARKQFDVSVCHFIFLANHFHILLVVKNPEDVSRFMGYIKAESAHAANRLLGRRQRTIWQDGYDSPVILTAEDVKKYIRYIYLNPARANLVESICCYPGVSSWKLFTSDKLRKVCKRLNRDSLRPLWNAALSINEQRRLVAEYEKQPGTDCVFELEPNAWMECFPELAGSVPEEVNAEIISEIKTAETSLSEKRRAERKRVVGATALRRESMTKEHIPAKHGRRMICLSHHRELRRAFIASFRALCDEAQKVYRAWQQGDLGRRIPPGMFAPGIPVLASALPILL